MPDTDQSTVHEVSDDSMISQRPISQIPFAASSNATPSTNLSPLIVHTAQRRDNSLGGGKLGKSTRSWGNLPNNVIHKILDYMIQDVPKHWTLEQTWGQKAGSNETANVLTQRKRLCELRLISREWNFGVDSHAFWPLYTLILDPSRDHGSTVADLTSSRITPSTPSFPTLFHRARHTTLGICLPCRLNHPGRLGLYPAVGKLATWSNYLGAVPTCLRHGNKYCTCCLKEEAGINRGKLQPDTRLGAYPKDVDDQGRPYVHPIICQNCREGTLRAHLQRQLTICARGGEVNGQVYDIMQHSETVDDYFIFGQINAVDTAKHALREAWIFYQTGYETLKPILLSLQRCEDATKRDYLKTGVFEPRYRSIERAGLLLNLFDEAGPIQSHDNIWQIFLSIQNRYDEWTEEAGDEYEEDEGPENLDLTTYWVQVGQEAAIYRWARDRVRSGFWVLPSDEVDAITQPNRGLITDPEAIIDSAHLPLGVVLNRNRAYRVDELPFYIRYDGRERGSDTDGLPDSSDTFLPPQSLLRDLDHFYQAALCRYLQASVKSRIQEQLSCHWGDDQLRAGKPDLAGMLEYFQSEEAWQHILPYRAPVSLSIRAPLWEREQSPEIEIVAVPYNEVNEFNIVQLDPDDSDVELSESSEEMGTGSEVDDGTPERVPPTLLSISSEEDEVNDNGKRKSPPSDETGSPPSKRHSSDEHSAPNPAREIKAMLNGEGNSTIVGNEGHDNDNINEKEDDNDNANDKSETGSTPPTRKSSEDSLTSSSNSNQSDLILRTPKIDSDRSRGRSRIRSILLTHEGREAALRKRIDERAEAEPRIAKGDVPHIPSHTADGGLKLGSGTEEILSRIWDHVLQPYLVCRCQICTRGAARGERC